MDKSKEKQVVNIVLDAIRKRCFVSQKVAEVVTDCIIAFGIEPSDEEYERWTIGFLRAVGHEQIDRASVLGLVAIAKDKVNYAKRIKCN
jgi:hypothetical protein